ncbi:hypothetical protein DFH11DRAFT_1578444 [Phellopilus nigrolimitatus]|nr:hypothetical protein DFH11DRAFT_1578444 [Phellopilus nigrolimitatus]
MNSYDNMLGAEPQPRSSMESRMSRVSRMTTNQETPASPSVPKLPETKFDVSLSLDQLIAGTTLAADIDPKKKEQMEKRQSNVLRLAQENEKLNAELQAMSERLRAAEARTQAILAARERKAKEGLGGQGPSDKSTGRR